MKRIVVVGHGSAVRAHASRYERLDGATVCGVVSSGDRSDSPADAPSYDSVAEALAAADADGVDVCGPGFRYDAALDAALDAAVPMRCDPPVALDAERFEAVRAAASDGEGWVLAHSPHRFSRLYEQLRTGVQRGSIGDIGVARVTRTAPFDGNGWNVTYDGLAGVDDRVDALCAVAAHDVDVFEWTFGPVERAFARASEGDRCDNLHALLAFRDGGRATVEVTRCAESVPSSRVEVEYSGSHGRLDFEDGAGSPALREGSDPLPVDPPQDDCRGRSLRAFLDALEGGEEPAEGVAPTLASRGAIAVRRSTAEGRPVPLAEVSE